MHAFYLVMKIQSEHIRASVYPSHVLTTAAPDDYIHPIMGGVRTTFAPTDNLKTVNIFITDDNRLESSESYFISLVLPSSNQVGLQIGEPATATVIITDDDSELNLHKLHFTVYGNLHMHVTSLCFHIIIDYSLVIVLQLTGVMVGFDRGSYNVSESNSYVEVVVVKQGSSDVNVTVLLRTADGTASGEFLDCQ